MAIKFIFCEGIDKSLDKQLLEKGIFPHLDNPLFPPKIIPVGGKTQMGNYIKGYFSLPKVDNQPSTNAYIALRDRDFDLPLEKSKNAKIPELKFPESRSVAYLHRITIENYLIKPDTLFAYLKSKITNFAKFNIQAVEDVHLLMEEAAEDLYHYSIARHTIGCLKKRRPHLKSTWTSNSGKLPIERSENDCIKELYTFFSESQAYYSMLSEESIKLEFDAMLEKLPKSRYLDRSNPNDNYLSWCHGKDLITAIEESLASRMNSNAFTLSSDEWWEFALSKFEYTDFPDLIQLRDIINGSQEH